jgi:hypothetical protein
MNRAARRLAVATGLAAFVLAGCGSSDGDTNGSDGDTNGLEEMSAAEVLQEAAAALTSAESVHVAGSGIDEETAAEIDVRIQGDSSSGTLTVEGVTTEIIVIGEDTYLKSDERGLENAGAPAEAQQLGAGRWLKLDPGTSSLEGFTVDELAAQLTQFESPLEPEVEQTTLDGTQVVVVRREDGTRIYVANIGAANPLLAEWPNEGQLDFTEYGADFQITAPQNYVELGELAWLDAITKLHAKIDKPFLASEINLTQATMVSLGSALGECSRALARIGSPTERLQPVHALVAEACALYDEGAKCFDTAASVSDRSGAVVAGTPEEQTQITAIECGLAAQGDGGNLLTEAEAMGHEIINAPAG